MSCSDSLSSFSVVSRGDANSQAMLPAADSRRTTSTDVQSLASSASSFVSVQQPLAVLSLSSNAEPSVSSYSLPVSTQSNTTEPFVAVQGLSLLSIHAPSNSDDVSVISGFSILNLEDGCTLHCCHRCTYHNLPDTNLCQSCGAALVANPCLQADYLVALGNQIKHDKQVARERQQALANLSTQHLFQQALVLVQFLCHILPVHDDSIFVLSHNELLTHADDFLDHHRQHGSPSVRLQLVVADQTGPDVALSGFTSPLVYANEHTVSFILETMRATWEDMQQWTDADPGKQGAIWWALQCGGEVNATHTVVPLPVDAYLLPLIQVAPAVNAVDALEGLHFGLEEIIHTFFPALTVQVDDMQED